MTITYNIIILKIDSMMIIIFVIIIHIIFNEKGAFVINLINILIVLITMMTVIRLAINIDVVMILFVCTNFGLNTDLMNSHFKSNGNQTHPCQHSYIKRGPIMKCFN